MLVQEEEVRDAEAFDDESRSYQEAMNSSAKLLWIEAMREKMSSLKANNKWSMKELLYDQKALPSKLVFMKKLGIDGKVVQHKA